MNKYIYLFIYLFIYLLIINKHSSDALTFFTGQWPCTCSRTSAKEARFNSVPLHWTRSSNYFLQLRHSTPPVRTATRHGEETEQDSADGRKFVRPVLSVMSVALMHVQNLTNWQLTQQILDHDVSSFSQLFVSSHITGSCTQLFLGRGLL